MCKWPWQTVTVNVEPHNPDFESICHLAVHLGKPIVVEKILQLWETAHNWAMCSFQLQLEKIISQRLPHQTNCHCIRHHKNHALSDHQCMHCPNAAVGQMCNCTLHMQKGLHVFRVIYMVQCQWSIAAVRTEADQSPCCLLGVPSAWVGQLWSASTTNVVKQF